MSTSTTSSTLSPVPGQPPVWKAGIIAAVTASIVTTALAAAASAAGVSFENSNSEGSIPIPTFAIFTLVFSLIGIGIAAVVARKAARPRATFLRVAVILLALSLAPDLTFGFDAGSAATLIGLHLVAAAIVIPALVKCLPADRTAIAGPEAQ